MTLLHLARAKFDLISINIFDRELLLFNIFTEAAGPPRGNNNELLDVWTVWHLQPYGLYGAHMDIDNSQPAWPDEALPTTRIVKKALFHIFFTHLIGAASTEQFETMRLHTGLSETMWSGLSCMQPHRFATQPRLRSALECCSRTVVVLKLRRTTGVKV